MSGAAHWETEAERWVAWARAPRHDSYWTESREPFLALLPPAGRRTLDLGCGEGRVARDLTAAGHTVTGVDVSATMIRFAQEADPVGDYRVADAARLPFADGEFDLVVAFNSLMDIDDMSAAVREAARVLASDGHFCLCITHPMRDAGGFEDERFVITEDYLERRQFELEVARGGLELHIRSWAYPLEAYMRALEEAGFLVEALREPRDPSRHIPNFLLLRAKASGPGGSGAARVLGGAT